MAQSILAEPRYPRYRALDLWRGVACLAVVAYHASLFCHTTHPQSGISGLLVSLAARGWIGVPVFFVISGYCISATADSARRKQHAPSHYFLRRFRRIFPPYWICLAGTIAFTAALHCAGYGTLVSGYFGDIGSIPSPGTLRASQWFGNITLTETWRNHIIPPATRLIVCPAWTLCYEEQFYALTGLLLIVAPRRFFLGALLISLAVILCIPFGFESTGFFWDGRWLLFAAGVGLYHAINYAGAVGRRLFIVACCIAIAYDLCRLLGCLATAWNSIGLHRNEAIAGFGFALALLALQPKDDTLVSSPLTRPFLACGRMCYSLYLVHFPIVIAISHAAFLAGLRSAFATATVTIPLCIAASVSFGWLFYVTVERHFLNSPRWNRVEKLRTDPAPAEA